MIVLLILVNRRGSRSLYGQPTTAIGLQGFGWSAGFPGLSGAFILNFCGCPVSIMSYGMAKTFRADIAKPRGLVQFHSRPFGESSFQCLQSLLNLYCVRFMLGGPQIFLGPQQLLLVADPLSLLHAFLLDWVKLEKICTRNIKSMWSPLLVLISNSTSKVQMISSSYQQNIVSLGDCFVHHH